MEQILRAGLLALGLPDAGVPALLRYAHLLMEKNKVMDLTAITEPTAVARRHLLDSAALLPLADFRDKSLVDVGTGAGLPGLPLRLIEPAIRLTLLDAQRKRVDFLRAVCGELAPDAACIHARAEDFAAERREGFDLAVSRAVAPLRILCELCLPLMRPGGWFLAMKSTGCGDELLEARQAVALLGGGDPRIRDYRIPGTEICHRLVLIPKVRPTPARYPRPFPKIKREPI